MGSQLKRKRDSLMHSSSSTHSSASSTSSNPRSVEILQDATTSNTHQPGDQSALTHQLQLSLLEMQSCSARIESILRQLSPAPRSALTQLAAPAQASHTHDSSRASFDISPKFRLGHHQSGCTNCKVLQGQISILQAEAKAHEREREAWKAFKSWWLSSLSKREQKNRRRIHHNIAQESSRDLSSRSAGTSVKVELSAKHPKHDTRALRGVDSGDAVRGAGAEGKDRLAEVVRRLDRTTKGIWERAGIIPSEGAADGQIEVDSGSQRDQSDGAESATNQSELTLPLHAFAPDQLENASNVPVETSSSHATVPITAEPPHHIHTVITTRPSEAVREVGYVDSTPIRSRIQRRTLLAYDCPDCQLFYSHFDNLTDQNGRGQIERMACSRHRSTFKRAVTPDGYWNIAFPTTQEADQINADVRQQRVEKH